MTEEKFKKISITNDFEAVETVEAKSLKTLATAFRPIDDPKTDAEQLCNYIHKIAADGYVKICEQQLEIERLLTLLKERR